VCCIFSQLSCVFADKIENKMKNKHRLKYLFCSRTYSPTYRSDIIVLQNVCFFQFLNCRPKSGSMLLYSRKKVRYRRDGYCWKKRKDGKTTREDHMKLKVQGTECIYGCYVHSAILPTFHRRCYWLLQVRCPRITTAPILNLANFPEP
jgi:hypothetical protein